jgi:hypothetical protein
MTSAVLFARSLPHEFGPTNSAAKFCPPLRRTSYCHINILVLRPFDQRKSSPDLPNTGYSSAATSLFVFGQSSSNHSKPIGRASYQRFSPIHF